MSTIIFKQSGFYIMQKKLMQHPRLGLRFQTHGPFADPTLTLQAGFSRL